MIRPLEDEAINSGRSWQLKEKIAGAAAIEHYAYARLNSASNFAPTDRRTPICSGIA